MLIFWRAITFLSYSSLPQAVLLPFMLVFTLPFIWTLQGFILVCLIGHISRWRHLTTAIRIYFVFSFLFIFFLILICLMMHRPLLNTACLSPQSWSSRHKSNNYSFKIFLRVWLAKLTRIIHCNQLMLTKFGRILPYWTDDVKSAAKVADYWTVNQQNLWTS